MRNIGWVVAILCVLVGGGAGAHAFLVRSEPAVGAAVAAPRVLRLAFSEAVEPALSGVEVASEAGARLALRSPRFEGGDRKVLVVDLPRLAPGRYRVTWHVVSVDMHATEGDFTFRVRP